MIEDHYLYTRLNIVWDATEGRLLRDSCKGRKDAFRMLSGELATLGRCERNAVSKSQPAALRKEPVGKRIGNRPDRVLDRSRLEQEVPMATPIFT
jgi:hypothetical protein